MKLSAVAYATGRNFSAEKKQAPEATSRMPRTRCKGARFVRTRSQRSLGPHIARMSSDCMHRVSYMTDSATRILHDLREMLAVQDKALVYSRIRGRAVVEDALTRTLPDGSKGYLTFEDNDLAVEWCENRLIPDT